MKEYNWRNCKQLWTKYTHFFSFSSNFKLRNTTQSTSLSFRFLQLFHFTTWLENFLKTSEDQVIKASVVIRFDVVYPRVSLSVKSKSVLFYSFFATENKRRERKCKKRVFSSSEFLRTFYEVYGCIRAVLSTSFARAIPRQRARVEGTGRGVTCHALVQSWFYI